MKVEIEIADDVFSALDVYARSQRTHTYEDANGRIGNDPRYPGGAVDVIREAVWEKLDTLAEQINVPRERALREERVRLEQSRRDALKPTVRIADAATEVGVSAR